MPYPQVPIYSPSHVVEFLSQHHSPSAAPVLVLAFSAGVVGALGAARLWQGQGGKVSALVALDGWGVALGEDFPVHRLSHDWFTDWSSALLGPGREDFYADPPVPHLFLWHSPQQTWGWWKREQGSQLVTAATVLAHWLTLYDLPTYPPPA